MKLSKKTICMLVLLFCISLSLTGCSGGYSQEEMDEVSESYESTISDLQSELSSAQQEIISLQEQLNNLASTPSTSVPAGMSDEIYAYGITLLTNVDDYIIGSISLEECYNNTSDFMGDLILADKTSLSLIDQDCYKYMEALYLTISNLYRENYSKYSQEEFETILLPGCYEALFEALGL